MINKLLDLPHINKDEFDELMSEVSGPTVDVFMSGNVSTAQLMATFIYATQSKNKIIIEQPNSSFFMTNTEIYDLINQHADEVHEFLVNRYGSGRTTRETNILTLAKSYYATHNPS